MLVKHNEVKQTENKTASDGRRIAISASTTQSLESNAGVLLSHCCTWLHFVYKERWLSLTNVCTHTPLVVMHVCQPTSMCLSIGLLTDMFV